VSDQGFEIICDGCRTPVSSTAPTCPSCGRVLIGADRPAAPEPLFPIRRPPAQALVAGSTFGAAGSWERPASERAPGGFWIRVGANLIDSVVLVLPTVALELSLGTVGSVANLFVSWLYFSVMEGSGSQGTLGKLACGLAVTDTHGRRISFGRATGRYFAKILSALTLGIGFLMVAFMPRKQGLHDVVAGTLVVRS
jgi:uncharacterized RDD family membrane protein YckC